MFFSKGTSNDTKFDSPLGFGALKHLNGIPTYLRPIWILQKYIIWTCYWFRRWHCIRRNSEMFFCSFISMSITNFGVTQERGRSSILSPSGCLFKVSPLASHKPGCSFYYCILILLICCVFLEIATSLYCLYQFWFYRFQCYLCTELLLA